METPIDIWILTDYRGAFYSTVRNCWGHCSLDLNALKQEFANNKITAHIVPYAQLDLRKESFKNRLVLYQSSEDNDAHYKDFIEDLLLGIQLQGGILIPPFHCFRAHHNKVFMEVLRDISGDALFQRNINTSYFGTFEDFEQLRISCPVVIKKAWGAGSRGVRLANSPADANKIAYRFSRSAGFFEIAKEWYRNFFRYKLGYVRSSFNRNKFLTQNFVEGLSGDYKILVYWDKYYVLSRKNRPSDFRASGSGLFSWPQEPPDGLLDYAKHIYKYFNVPMISLDIAFKNNVPFVIEFQFVCFGTLTMEKSDWYFIYNNNRWEVVYARSIPEIEFARSVANYIKFEKLYGWQ